MPSSSMWPDLVPASLHLRGEQQDKDRLEVGTGWRGMDQGRHLVLTGRFGTPIHPRTGLPAHGPM